MTKQKWMAGFVLVVLAIGAGVIPHTCYYDYVPANTNTHR
jgi:hypothetical protein